MFNLEKYSQIPQEPIAGDLIDGFNDLGDTYEGEPIEETTDEIIDTVDEEKKQILLEQAKNLPVWQYFLELETNYPELRPDLDAVKVKIQDVQNSMTPAAIEGLREMLKQEDLGATLDTMEQSPDIQISKESILNAAMKAKRDRTRNESRGANLPLSAFNLKRTKEAQLGQMENMGASRFPVVNLGDFISKFADDLLAWDGTPGTPGSEAARLATEEIRDAVSPGFEEEANSILQAIREFDPATEQDAAQEELVKIYKILIPKMLKEEQQEMPQETQSAEPMEPMEPVMSQKKPKGIVRYNLNDHILNNPPTEDIIKTASTDQFGQQYLLYGPTEKRICPKLRGKNLSVGDVVSEYTCRHHCIDGIVIDDNKTVCGEALWRANAMDKFSREYVDADGNIEGGYLNKRFEINRNVPEENKMRLKPGENRKPRPASQGNLESRLQDMRNKEGQKRDYRPNVNTGNPFEWCHDVDQNNVQVSQSERDKRETDAGHQLVQYTNRDQGENNPKKAFNLKSKKNTKTATQSEDHKRPKPGSHDEFREQSTINRMKREKCPKCNDKVCRCGTGDPGDPNLGANKTAELPQPHVMQPRRADPVHKPSPRDRHQPELNPSAAQAPKPADIDPRQRTFDSGKPMKKKRCFNLQNSKTSNKEAQIMPPKPMTGPPTHRTFDQMGKDFSPEGTFNHCQSCNKRVSTNELISEDNGTGGLMSVCHDCQKPGLNEEKPMPMTGPRGPVGPDNPQSDDLGISPDYNPMDDSTREDELYNTEPSPLLEELIATISGMDEKDDIMEYVTQQMTNPENQGRMNPYDWEIVIKMVIDKEKEPDLGLEESEFNEFNEFDEFDPNTLASSAILSWTKKEAQVSKKKS